VIGRGPRLQSRVSRPIAARGPGESLQHRNGPGSLLGLGLVGYHAPSVEGYGGDMHNRRRTYWNHRGDPAFEQVLFEAQGGRCPICGKSATCLDGSYRTGQVRGWLCRTCYTGLGMFKDSPTRLRRAITYLETPPAKQLRAMQSASAVSPDMAQQAA
jgi:hypothetical protein